MAAQGVRTGEVTTAIKNAKGKVGAIKSGQIIGIVDHEIEVVGDDVSDVAAQLADLLLRRRCRDAHHAVPARTSATSSSARSLRAVQAAHPDIDDRDAPRRAAALPRDHGRRVSDDREAQCPRSASSPTARAMSSPPGLRELGVEMVPLTVHFGDEHFRDWIDLHPEEFYAKLAHSPLLPTTSQPSPADFAAAYARLAEQGFEEIVVDHAVVSALRHVRVGDARRPRTPRFPFASSTASARRRERRSSSWRPLRRATAGLDAAAIEARATEVAAFVPAVLPARHARLPRQGRSCRQGDRACCLAPQHQAGPRGQRRRDHRAVQEGSRPPAGRRCPRTARRRRVRVRADVCASRCCMHASSGEVEELRGRSGRCRTRTSRSCPTASSAR